VEAILEALELETPMSLPLVPLIYLALGGAYLVVLPALLLFYFKSRWYLAGSIERLFAYFFVFLLFPGLLILSPFVNIRPQPRQMG
jgi:NAD(P)H-quinone oxidoreductase subunit L